MFEISWSELLILAVVALVFVGPKDLPALFRTLGRYAGMLRRQATEFRQYFDDAMREAEFDRINKEVMELKDEVTGTVAAAEKAAQTGVSEMTDKAKDATKAAESEEKTTDAETKSVARESSESTPGNRA